MLTIFKAMIPKLHTLLLMVMGLLSFSCSGQTLESSPAPSVDASIALFSANLSRNFREDFVVNANNKPTNIWTPELKEAFRLSFSPDRIKLKASYSYVKATLLSITEADKDLVYTYAVQNITLRYLRRVFLHPEAKPSDIREVAFLLRTTLPYQPVDMDVLADAYVACQDMLSTPERAAFLQYMRTLYAKKVPKHQSNSRVLEEAIAASEDESQAAARLSALRHCRMMLESLEYANDRLVLSPGDH